jgi:SMC interacting uncharacterized protein involved in chromosome segregation
MSDQQAEALKYFAVQIELLQSQLAAAKANNIDNELELSLQRVTINELRAEIAAAKAEANDKLYKLESDLVNHYQTIITELRAEIERLKTNSNELLRQAQMHKDEWVMEAARLRAEIERLKNETHQPSADKTR